MINVDHLCGWKNRPEEVEKVVSMLKHQDGDKYIKYEGFQYLADDNEPTLLYKYFKDVTGNYAPSGPQEIGDCVSWGWGNGNNYVAVLQIWVALKKANLLRLLNIDYAHSSTNHGAPNRFVKGAIDDPDYPKLVSILEEYQETCTEWIYGSSRVEIGGQKGDYQDGSVGAWAAKAVAQIGTLSRKKLGKYDPKRAKQWGADGVPDDLEPEAKKHLFTDVVPVTSFDQARTLIKTFRPIPVCSNQGFTMTRDEKGRCSPKGTWPHCMVFVAETPNQLLCAQSWGPNTPNGPLYLDQPDNTFWVDAAVADKMLKAQDSFSPAGFLGYTVDDFLSWQH